MRFGRRKLRGGVFCYFGLFLLVSKFTGICFGIFFFILDREGVVMVEVVDGRCRLVFSVVLWILLSSVDCRSGDFRCLDFDISRVFLILVSLLGVLVFYFFYG